MWSSQSSKWKLTCVHKVPQVEDSLGSKNFHRGILTVQHQRDPHEWFNSRQNNKSDNTKLVVVLKNKNNKTKLTVKLTMHHVILTQCCYQAYQVLNFSSVLNWRSTGLQNPGVRFNFEFKQQSCSTNRSPTSSLLSSHSVPLNSPINLAAYLVTSIHNMEKNFKWHCLTILCSAFLFSFSKRSTVYLYIQKNIHKVLSPG